ncbi:NAD(P)/FAD-dependent oxidoreductase [Thermus hydrothermalis]|uniref:NAD(P)/FAD-dependent oxidoreductase n=1 Tax=Thermus hydrothermalis TaxID=2908148 RepID=UPI001FAAAB47|nr:FAD-binding oxidoreductase [Thermus hydrothermalis]
MPEEGVLVVGAGILGLSAAHFLAQRGFPVLVLEREAPLLCTSDKSTECYRVFWPGEEALASLVARSLELLGPFAEAARPRPRGYLYLGEAEGLLSLAQQAPHAGPLRVHPKAATYPRVAEEGMDLLLPGSLGEAFPYLAHLKGKAGLHVRKAGWLSAHGLGMALLEALRAAGGRVVAGEFLGLEREGGRPRYARVRWGEEEALWPFAALVLAPGPGLPALLSALDLTLPVAAEPHFKAWFPDPLGLFPREAPLLIWNEPQEIFAPEEKTLFQGEATLAPLLSLLPPGAHARPEGEGFLALYNPWPQAEAPGACGPTPPPWAGEVALRGLFPILPGLRRYLGARPRVDGGYYVRTPENLPLLGPVAEGVYLLGAFSGYGVMAALGAREALARMVAGEDPPSWARGFRPSRYQDPGYRPQGAAARAQL